MLLVGMFSGLPIRNRTTSWCALLWGKLSFLLSAFLVSCLGWSPLEHSLPHVSLSVAVVVIVLFLFRQPCWPDSLGIPALTLLVTTVSRQTPCYIVYCSLSDSPVPCVSSIIFTTIYKIIFNLTLRLHLYIYFLS